MNASLHQLFSTLLKAERALGVEQFPLSPKTLEECLKNEALYSVSSASAPAPTAVVTAEQTPSLALEPEMSNVQEEEQPAPFTLPEGSKQEQWQWLKQHVLSDPQCLSHVYPGKQLVFGSGNLDADIFFCGEAPGADEEEQGEVFVGRAGQLLTKIIEAMGIKRSDVYIGNIMNWRPETPNHIGNRPPTQEEMQFCLPYLIGQVKIVQPKVVVALGATAVSGLLGYDAQRRMRDCRGHWFKFQSIPLMVTYHPSYLLRNATKEAKRIVWEDMLLVMQFLNYLISERQKNYFL